jgi:hypothetical protein
MEAVPFREMHSWFVVQSPPVEHTLSDVQTELANSGPFARQSLVDSHCSVEVSTMKLQELAEAATPENASKIPAQRTLEPAVAISEPSNGT